jgi:site-specific recombinase XerD
LLRPKHSTTAPTVVLLGGDAGLRLGEVLALEQTRCDTRNERLLVELSEVKGEVQDTKGLAFRSLRMTPRLCEAIRVQKHSHGPRLLLNDEGEPVTPALITKWLAAAQKAAGIAKTTGEAHILRHTFCSHLAMKGVPVLTIQKLAGHKNLNTTLRYMHLAEGETDRAIRLLAQSRTEMVEKAQLETKMAAE